MTVHQLPTSTRHDDFEHMLALLEEGSLDRATRRQHTLALNIEIAGLSDQQRERFHKITTVEERREASQVW